MPKNRYERRELTHSWEDIRPLLKDSTQTTYEIIRPVLLFGISPKERSAETGMSKSSIYYKEHLFDQAGMASLFPPTPPPDIPKQDKRVLAPPIRQAIIGAHAEYSELSLHEIASICYVQFGRKPSPHTIKYILATDPEIGALPAKSKRTRRVGKQNRSTIQSESKKQNKTSSVFSSAVVAHQDGPGTHNDSSGRAVALSTMLSSFVLWQSRCFGTKVVGLLPLDRLLCLMYILLVV